MTDQEKLNAYAGHVRELWCLIAKLEEQLGHVPTGAYEAQLGGSHTEARAVDFIERQYIAQVKRNG